MLQMSKELMYMEGTVTEHGRGASLVLEHHAGLMPVAPLQGQPKLRVCASDSAMPQLQKRLIGWSIYATVTACCSWAGMQASRPAGFELRSSASHQQCSFCTTASQLQQLLNRPTSLAYHGDPCRPDCPRSLGGVVLAASSCWEEH